MIFCVSTRRALLRGREAAPRAVQATGGALPARQLDAMPFPLTVAAIPVEYLGSMFSFLAAIHVILLA